MNFEEAILHKTLNDISSDTESDAELELEVKEPPTRQELDNALVDVKYKYQEALSNALKLPDEERRDIVDKINRKYLAIISDLLDQLSFTKSDTEETEDEGEETETDNELPSPSLPPPPPRSSLGKMLRSMKFRLIKRRNRIILNEGSFVQRKKKRIVIEEEEKPKPVEIIEISDEESDEGEDTEPDVVDDTETEPEEEDIVGIDLAEEAEGTAAELAEREEAEAATLVAKFKRRVPVDAFVDAKEAAKPDLFDVELLKKASNPMRLIAAVISEVKGEEGKFGWKEPEEEKFKKADMMLKVERKRIAAKDGKVCMECLKEVSSDLLVCNGLGNNPKDDKDKYICHRRWHLSCYMKADATNECREDIENNPLWICIDCEEEEEQLEKLKKRRVGKKTDKKEDKKLKKMLESVMGPGVSNEQIAEVKNVIELVTSKKRKAPEPTIPVDADDNDDDDDDDITNFCAVPC